MQEFKPEQYEKIVTIGEGKFDYKIQNHINSELSFRVGFTTTMRNLANDELESFFDYQYKNSSFPYIVVYLICKVVTTGGTKKHREKAFDWLNENTNLSKYYINSNKIKSFFIKPPIRTEKLESWSDKLRKHMEYQDEIESLEFLKFGELILKDLLLSHQMVCTAKFGCQIEEGMKKVIKMTETLVLEYETKVSGDENKTLSFNRIQWIGTQKQLAELFIELKKKGWIDGFEYKAIKSCFTKSNTIHQVLKPTQDSIRKEESYDGVYTTRYEAMFYGIKENPKNI